MILDLRRNVKEQKMQRFQHNIVVDLVSFFKRCRNVNSVKVK